MLKRIVGRMVALCKLNFYAHHNQFDVIRLDQCYPPEIVHKCYLHSLVYFVLVALYGILGLECESRPQCQFNWTELPSSPFFSWHQMFPRAFWPQMNMLALNLTVFCTGCWISFLFNPLVDSRFLIFTDRARDYRKSVLEQMCALRTKFIKLALGMEFTLCTTGWAFCYVHVWWVNSAFTTTVTSLLFWAVFNPLYLYFIIVLIYTVPFYAILASKYITIQQKMLLSKLATINAKLLKIAKLKSVTAKRAACQRLWSKYICINMDICVLCSRVREYSRFWSPYLTILFLTYISLQCYVFYMVLFSSELSPVLQVILLLIVLGVVFNELMLITHCAAVVKHCRQFTVHNRTFYQRYRAVPVGKILQRNLAKAENLQVSRLLHSYAFRLFGNYRITNKSFYVIISYIGTFFLFISKTRH